MAKGRSLQIAEKVMFAAFKIPKDAGGEMRGKAVLERVEATVAELMRLCDALEAALVRGEVVKGRLLEAVLADPPAAGAGGTVPKKYEEPKGEMRMAAEP